MAAAPLLAARPRHAHAVLNPPSEAPAQRRPMRSKRLASSSATAGCVEARCRVKAPRVALAHGFAGVGFASLGSDVFGLVSDDPMWGGCAMILANSMVNHRSSASSVDASLLKRRRKPTVSTSPSLTSLNKPASFARIAAIAVLTDVF